MTAPARRLPCLLAAALAILLAASGSVARASIQIFDFSARPSTAQAGAHPDFLVDFSNSSHQGEPTACACNDARNVDVHLPAGLIGNPHATPQCVLAEFAANLCPADAQIGVAEVKVADAAESSGVAAGFLAPVYNLIPPPGEPGLLAFKSGLYDSPTFEVIGARTNSDYGLDVDVTAIEHFYPPVVTRQVTWGVPAAAIHDNLRFERGEPGWVQILTSTPILCDESGDPSPAGPGDLTRVCPDSGAIPTPPLTRQPGVAYVGLSGHPVSSDSPHTPFTQNPTTCGEASLETSLDILAYDRSEAHASSTWPATTDCDALTFNPSLFAKPSTTATDSPSGLDVDLKAPSFESPKTPSPSEIRGTTVTLPPGFTINPNTADGKTDCTDAAALFGTKEEARCPQFAKIGTLEVHSPVLPGVLPGAVYIGEPKPGERYRLIIAFDGFGIHVKLPGTVHPDPNTGQLVTEFKNLPQFPFEDFDLHFFGSERGILATPSQCGTYPVTTVFEPWDGALSSKTSTQFFTLDEGPGGSACPNGARPFSPGFEAGVTKSVAAAHSTFSLDLSRADGEQNLTGLSVKTPPGFSATLKGIPYCPQAAIDAASALGYSGLAEQQTPSCPPASQVGEAFAGSGAGSHPFYAPGKVYLAGPYKGAPLSLVVITPAVSGPYDLGDVVVRTALRVNEETAQVTAVSDSLPQILEGVPLRLRSVLVELNRPNFALNPTNCEPLAVEASVTGSEGATATPSQPFQVANCARLRFTPRLSLNLSGFTKRAGHPALKAVLRMKGGEANIARAQVTLPHSAFLDQENIGTVCTRVQFAAGNVPGERCPAASIYGHAKAITPLLDKPLEGNVYLRSSSHKLPDLVAALNGQINIALDGRIDTGRSGGIRNTFEVVPDAPVSRFVLEMKGGRKGLLVNSENLCSPKAKTHAIAHFVGQNGKVDDYNPVVANSCGAKGKRKRSRHGARVSESRRVG